MLLAALVLAALTLAGCSAATQTKVRDTAQTVATVLDKVQDSVQYLDAAFAVFCMVKPSLCTAEVRETYQRDKAIVSQALITARDTSQAVSSQTTDAVQKAYASLEKLLMDLNVIVPKQNVSAPRNDDWIPWTAPEPFAS